MPSTNSQVQLFPGGVSLIEVVDIANCDFESIYIGSNLGIIGSVIHQVDGGAYQIHKFMGEKINDQIILRKENPASINHVYVIILRTYNQVTAQTGRLLQETPTRVLEAGSVYGTLYISDAKVNEEGEPAPFNWLLWVVVPGASVLVLVLVVVFICCCCCRKGSEAIPAPQKKYTPAKPKDTTPTQSERTIHDGSHRDVQQPIYMPSDRSLGGKPIPLESRKDIPKTQDNSLILDKSLNTPERSREPSPEKSQEPTPADSPGRGRRRERDVDAQPSREVSQDISRDMSGENTPGKSPKRRVRRRRNR